MTDTVVVGAGTSGCVVAARLAEKSRELILLLEAGGSAVVPGPGIAAFGRIPNDLDWRIFAQTSDPTRQLWLPRGKGVGGCSLLQGGIALRSFSEDYENWASVAGSSWSEQSAQAGYRRIESDPNGGGGPVVIKTLPAEARQPLHRAFLEGVQTLGIPWCSNFNSPSATGAGPAPLAGGTLHSNVLGWYLEGQRNRLNLSIEPYSEVRRLIVEGKRVVAAEVLRNGSIYRIEAGRFVLSAGTLGTPEILLRSGVGPPEEVIVAGVPVTVALPAVGRHLRDHVALWLTFEPQKGQGAPGSPWFQVILREQEGLLPDSTIEAFYDFRVTSAASPQRRAVLTLGLLDSRARGSVRLDSADTPVVSLGYPCLADYGSLRRLLGFAGKLLATPAMRRLAPGPVRLATVTSHGAKSQSSLPRSLPWDLQSDVPVETIEACLTTMHHLYGTCRMGSADDSEAVVDETGKVHGLDNLYVADASLIPVTFRANTHLVSILIGEKMAGVL